MPYRERARDRGVRRSRASLAEIGRELRQARQSAGLRQSDVARASGVSASWVSRVERGVSGEVGLRLLSVMLAVVGMDLSVRAYPGANPLRDEGHRRLLVLARGLLPEDAPWQTEVPFPNAGDQRAWDAVTRLWDLRVGIEAELRPNDLQALQRRLALKLRDGGVDHLVLALPATRHNRALLRHAGQDLRAMFPLQGREALAALKAATDPGCNLLIMV
jgi:transcriptional regulator with XRE-family HTH domain